MVRETEVLVYAVGHRRQTRSRRSSADAADSAAAYRQPRMPIPFPVSWRARRARAAVRSRRYPPGGSGGRAAALSVGGSDDRVNVAALREITDDSGGRTEIVRDSRDLDPAVASIADELSQQVLPRLSESRASGTAAGTPSASRCATRRLKVRARRGYVATP